MGQTNIIKAAMFTPTANGWGIPLAGEGEPGVGKSAIIKALARKWGFPTYVLDGAKGEGAYGVIPVPTQRADGWRITYPAPEWVDAFAHGGVVFCDELTTNDERVQRAMLGLMLDKVIGSHTFGPRVRVLGAMNPVELSAGGTEISAPVANRLCWLKWATPSVSEHAAYMMNALAGADTVDDAEAEEERVSAQWGATFAEAVGLETAFLTNNPQWKNRCPKPGDASLGRAWPSDRSWEVATRAFASSNVHGLTSTERDEFVTGCIGAAAYEAFAAFVETADMPNVPDLLDGKVKFVHDARRLDRTAAVLASATALVLDKQCPARDVRVETLWRLLGEAGASCADITVPAAEGLTKAGLHVSKAAMPVLTKLHPVLKAARGGK